MVAAIGFGATCLACPGFDSSPRTVSLDALRSTYRDRSGRSLRAGVALTGLVARKVARAYQPIDCDTPFPEVDFGRTDSCYVSIKSVPWLVGLSNAFRFAVEGLCSTVSQAAHHALRNHHGQKC